VIAEVGINHNGSLGMAKELIVHARRAGCDAVKFQKRTPELCVPRDQWDSLRQTPWGCLRYIDYKRRIEFGEPEYAEIDALCQQLHIMWFASCWDQPSVAFLKRFQPPCYKVASASVTDLPLLGAMKATGRPLILSTGMSTLAEVEAAVRSTGTDGLLLAHVTSVYPCPNAELNLRMITTLKAQYPECPVGYSGHEMGLRTTWAAVALGATFVERHITLDRTLWGSDHAASVEVGELPSLVSGIREVEEAVGDGVKHVYAGELVARRRLRRVVGACAEAPACPGYHHHPLLRPPVDSHDEARSISEMR
jgi:N-acetylneuraminate synthase